MRVLVLLLFLTGCATRPNQGWLEWNIERAVAQNKPLVVEFYATWCKPCAHFEQHILPDPRVQAALADFTFVRYDIETPAGRDAYQRCRGTGIPLVVGIDGDGVIRVAKQGQERTADNFLRFLAAARQALGGA